MTIHKCDICGQEIGAWFEVDVGIGAKNPNINIAELLRNRGKYEICQSCLLDLKNYVSLKGEQNAE